MLSMFARPSSLLRFPQGETEQGASALSLAWAVTYPRRLSLVIGMRRVRCCCAFESTSWSIPFS